MVKVGIPVLYDKAGIFIDDGSTFYHYYVANIGIVFDTSKSLQKLEPIL